MLSETALTAKELHCTTIPKQVTCLSSLDTGIRFTNRIPERIFLLMQELIRIGFDNNLYYEMGIYRTPTMIEMLAHNSNKMRELGLIDYQKNGGFYANPPLSGLNDTDFKLFFGRFAVDY